MPCPRCGRAVHTAHNLRTHLMGSEANGGHSLPAAEAEYLVTDVFPAHFNASAEMHQIVWRHQNIHDNRWGRQNGQPREWALHPDVWEEGLWNGIRTGHQNCLTNYLNENNMAPHTGAHNLKSSWVQCLNMFFPFSTDFRRAPILTPI